MADAPAGISGTESRRPADHRLGSRAGLAALVVTAFLAGASLALRPDLVSRASAQAHARPVGFADVVDKVKPAVISVRVKIDAGKRAKETSPFPKDSPLDRFFRRFGDPD